MDVEEREHQLDLHRKLVEAAHRLKSMKRYRGSWNTADVAHQAYLNLAERNPAALRNKDDAEIGALLWTAVANAIVDRRRFVGAKKRPPRPDELPEQGPANDDDVEEQVARSEILALIEVQLSRLAEGTGLNLPSERRAMLVALFRRAMSGESHDAIAADIGVDRSTVSYRLEFVVRFLREGIEEQGASR